MKKAIIFALLAMLLPACKGQDLSRPDATVMGTLPIDADGYAYRTDPALVQSLSYFVDAEASFVAYTPGPGVVVNAKGYHVSLRTNGPPSGAYFSIDGVAPVVKQTNRATFDFLFFDAPALTGGQYINPLKKHVVAPGGTYYTHANEWGWTAQLYTNTSGADMVFYSLDPVGDWDGVVIDIPQLVGDVATTFVAPIFIVQDTPLGELGQLDPAGIGEPVDWQ